MAQKRKTTMPSKKKTSKSVNWSFKKLDWKVVLVILLFAVAGTWLLAKSYAAPANKGGGNTGGGGSSLSVVMVTDANSDGLPNYGDTITFKINTTNTSPYIQLNCYQNSNLVYSASAGFYASYPWPWAQNMTLKSGTWTGGGANCTAVLNPGKKSLATLNFQTNP